MSFRWHPTRHFEYRIYDDNYDGPSEIKYQSSTEAIPTTIPAPVICTDIVWTKDFSSNLNVAATAAIDDDDDDDNKLNAKLKLDGKNLIGNLNGIQQEYLTAHDVSSYGNNYYNNIDKEVNIYDRSNAENPPSLPPGSNMLYIHSII